MINFDGETIRVTLHLLGVAIWVGGQIVLAALVPAVKAVGRTQTNGDTGPARAGSSPATKAMAQRFARVAWPAFIVTVVTGVWGLWAIDVASTTVGYQATLGLKLLLVAATGIAAFLHAASDQVVVKAATGAGGLVAALGALVCGVLMAT